MLSEWRGMNYGGLDVRSRSNQTKLDSRSAVERAIARLPDEDNSQMWVTVMEPGDDIDATVYDRLRTLGHTIKV